MVIKSESANYYKSNLNIRRAKDRIFQPDSGLAGPILFRH